MTLAANRSPSPEHRLATAFGVYDRAIIRARTDDDRRAAAVALARVYIDTAREAVRSNPDLFPRGHPVTHELLATVLAVEEAVSETESGATSTVTDPLSSPRDAALVELSRVEAAMANGGRGLANRLASLRKTTRDYAEAVQAEERRRWERLPVSERRGSRSDTIDPESWQLTAHRRQLERLDTAYREGLTVAEEYEREKRRVKWEMQWRGS